MSEKRFIIDAINPLHIHDNGTGEVITARSRMCDLLNELSDENEQLRQDLKSLETTSNATSDYNAHLEGKIITLENENEQLRKEKESWKNIACQD